MKREADKFFNNKLDKNKLLEVIDLSQYRNRSMGNKFSVQVKTIIQIVFILLVRYLFTIKLKA